MYNDTEQTIGRGLVLRIELTDREKRAIEQGLSHGGAPEVLVKYERGKIVILRVDKTRIQ